MLNLALSTVVDFQNIRDDNNVTSRQDLNPQNEDSEPVLPEIYTNIQPRGRYILKLLPLKNKIMTLA